MSNLSEFIGPVIKSVQSGTTSTNSSTNVTLTTAIDPAKSFIMINGTAAGVGGSSAPPYGRAEIINSTTITITEGNTISAGFITVYWTVVEYY
jgi:hypothetical protein